MSWTVNAGIGRRLLNAISTVDRMRGATRVMMASLDREQFGAFLKETLLLRDEDVIDAETISARIARTIATPCRVPAVMAEENQLEINGTTLALCRHLGIEPLRLQLAAFEAKATARRDGVEMSVGTMRPYGRQRTTRKPSLTVRLGLAPGVQWHDGSLIIRRTTLPQAMLATLRGRPASDVLDHDWPGWRDLTVRGAACTGDTLTVRMDQQTRVAYEDV